MRICTVVAFLLCLAGSSPPVKAQQYVLDPAQWGRVNLVVRQSLGGDVESILSRSGNHERLSTYDQGSRFRRMARPVGRLDVRFADGYFSTCTATLVQENVILTNHHCVPNIPANIRKHGLVDAATLVMNYYSEGETGNAVRYPVDINPISSSAERDFAYLRVMPSPTFPGQTAGSVWGVARMGSGAPRPGASLLIIHHPGGLPMHITRGNCRAARPNATTGDGIELLHLCDTLPGSSGAPIFSDDDGSIIGIHRAGAPVTGPGATNYGVLVAALTMDGGGSVTGGAIENSRNDPTPTPVIGRTPGIPEIEGNTGANTYLVTLDPLDSVGYQFELAMLGNSYWQERDLNGKLGNRLDELYRDEWSVYLRPSWAPHEVIQVDLNTMKVNAFENGKLVHVWSDIVDSSSPIVGQIGAYEAGIVRYDAGGAKIVTFADNGGGNWTENVSAGRFDRWSEVQRDDWSIYLANQAGETVQLDLYQAKVIRDHQGSRNPAYDIVFASEAIR